MGTVSLGTCSSLAVSGLSGISLDSAGGVLSCSSDGSYSQASATYGSGCGPVSASLVATYWQTGAGKVLTVSGSRACSSGSSTLESDFSTAAQQLATMPVFWAVLSIGILFGFSLNAIAYGIGTIRKLIDSGDA